MVHPAAATDHQPGSRPSAGLGRLTWLLAAATLTLMLATAAISFAIALMFVWVIALLTMSASPAQMIGPWDDLLGKIVDFDSVIAIPAAGAYLWWQHRAISESNKLGLGQPIVFRRRAILLPNILFIDLLDHHALRELHARFAAGDRFLGGRLIGAWLAASLTALGLMGATAALLQFGASVADAEPRLYALAGLALALAVALAAALAARIVFTIMRGDELQRIASHRGA